MNIIYTLSIIALTLLLNVTLTTAMPYVKPKLNAFITRMKRVFKRKPSVNQEQIDYLQEQINALSQKLQNRSSNDMQAIRKEVRKYLEQLKTK